MSLYQRLIGFGSRFARRSTLLKLGFNWSPMYRRSVAKVTEISEDLLLIKVELPINYKNKNYVGSIFGGSMFSAVDPFPMVQLINLLGDDYVVWDKSAEIFFKRPGREKLFAEFTYTLEEVEEIKSRVAAEKEIEIVRVSKLFGANKDKVICEVHKRLYIADKAYFKEKRKKR